MKKGFTLAEVLITLGIIGIVAAMTLPTLIQKHRKTAVETGLKKFYTNINQAVKLSEIDNGETKTWVFENYDTPAASEVFFNKYLKKYLKITKTGVVNVRYKKRNYEAYTIYFADGSACAMQYLGHNYIYCLKAKDLPNFDDKHGTGCFIFGLYPTISSKTYSGSNFRGKGIEPMVTDNIRNEDNEIQKDDDGKPIYATEKDLYAQKNYAKKIQLNGWRIPDDYPLKF